MPGTLAGGGGSNSFISVIIKAIRGIGDSLER